MIPEPAAIDIEAELILPAAFYWHELALLAMSWVDPEGSTDERVKSEGVA